MAVSLLVETPLAVEPRLGPYRRPDYERLADEPRSELIFGRLFVSPSPVVENQRAVLALARSLHDLAREHGGQLFIAPLDVALGEHTVVQPDLLYVSAARREMIRERIEGAPDLIIEVISAGTARRDRGEKLRLYAEAGVREYWIVDPAERQIDFLVLDGDRFAVALPEGSTYRSEVLPEIHLDVVALWNQVADEAGG